VRPHELESPSEKGNVTPARTGYQPGRRRKGAALNGGGMVTFTARDDTRTLVKTKKREVKAGADNSRSLGAEGGRGIHREGGGRRNFRRLRIN